MIEFACVYCGQALVVEDALACRQITCSACGHVLRVPHRAALQVARETPDPTKDIKSEVASQWENMTNWEIASRLLSRSPKPDDREKMARRLMLSPFLPKYDDLTLFTLGAAFVLLLLIDRNAVTKPVFSQEEGIALNVIVSMIRPFAGLLALAGVGMVVSLFGVFFKWQKPRIVRYAMLCFAVITTALTGMIAGYVTLRNAQVSWTTFPPQNIPKSWWMVFPAWNILNGVFLLVMLRAGVMDADCITDQKPSLWQIVLTLICISSLLAICHFGFRLHWAITYSHCVCYTMNLNHAIADVFTRSSEPSIPS
jgi:hypothetical protein